MHFVLMAFIAVWAASGVAAVIAFAPPPKEIGRTVTRLGRRTKDHALRIAGTVQRVAARRSPTAHG